MRASCSTNSLSGGECAAHGRLAWPESCPCEENTGKQEGGDSTYLVGIASRSKSAIPREDRVKGFSRHMDKGDAGAKEAREMCIRHFLWLYIPWAPPYCFISFVNLTEI
ncbi:hypothetical protein VTK73DRAFT_9449 [Phialemonium thermophilum]|uniref:Uncharacterized protein n=1 Tax=Phialemonium thermophilum TaxID=223376 RepID=A0ABR3W2C4_9PEZI